MSRDLTNDLSRPGDLSQNTRTCVVKTRVGKTGAETGQDPVEKTGQDPLERLLGGEIHAHHVQTCKLGPLREVVPGGHVTGGHTRPYSVPGGHITSGAIL